MAKAQSRIPFLSRRAGVGQGVAAWAGPVARWLAAAMVVAALCSGASAYLKRTGVLAHADYLAYWAHHCLSDDDVPDMRDEPQCHAHVDVPRAVAQNTWRGFTSAFISYVHEVSPAERPLKFAKDAVFVAILALSAWMLAASRSLRAIAPVSPLPVAFAVYVAIMLLVSLSSQGLMVAASGARALSFMAVALLAGWLAPYMATFAWALAGLLGLQLLLLPYELLHGIHMYQEWSALALAGRTFGTLVHPNSMGIFAATGFAFCLCFLPRRGLLPLLAVGAIALIGLSASATGLACAVVLCAVMVQRTMGGARGVGIALAFLLGVGMLALVGLPALLGRPDLFDSVASETGRLANLQQAVLGQPAAQALFGKGLGVNSNAALSIGVAGGLPTDSSLTGLIYQVGILGTCLFYALLAWAGWRDRQAAPFYVAVAVCSLTLNVTELFPVNLLLGLALARSLLRQSRGEDFMTPVHGRR
ncbi:MAG: hypothetical protein V4669_05575 [Pseudomonadota bacterium]